MRTVSPHEFQYVSSDLPVGMTLDAWRRARRAAAPTRRPRFSLRLRFA